MVVVLLFAFQKFFFCDHFLRRQNSFVHQWVFVRAFNLWSSLGVVAESYGFSFFLFINTGPLIVADILLVMRCQKLFFGLLLFLLYWTFWLYLSNESRFGWRYPVSWRIQKAFKIFTKLLPFLNQILQRSQKHAFRVFNLRFRFQSHYFLFQGICKMYKIPKILSVFWNKLIIVVNSAAFVPLENSSKILVEKSQFFLHFGFWKSQGLFEVFHFLFY